MPRRISVSRAARLVGVKRGSLQLKIRSGELKTFEGQLLLSDLLQHYPTTTIEDSSMLERVEQIIEQASFTIGDAQAREPDKSALSARVLAISRELAWQNRLLKRNDKFIATLKSRLTEEYDANKNQAADSSRFESFYNWCQSALADLENTDRQAIKSRADEVFLRTMTAQVTVLPSGHEFFVEGADTVLEAGLRGGLALNYGCSNGICGLCKARLVSGEAKKMRPHDYVLTEAEKNLGYFLCCANTAVSDLVIEADEASGVYDIPAQEIPIRIKKIDRPNDELIILNAKTPRTRRLRFLAGQSAELSIEAIGTAKYSIASCPCDDMNLQFHIPKRDQDPLAMHLDRDAQVNDSLLLQGPGGDFTLNEDSPNSLVFIAGGSGFAPIKSLIEHAMALDSAENIYLYWIAAGQRGHYLDNLCRSWNDALDNFDYRRIEDDASEDWIESLVSSLGSDHPELDRLDYYLSAGEAINTRIESFLLENRVPHAQVKTDSQQNATDE